MKERQEEETINNGKSKEADENITIYLDDIPFKTTLEGKKQLDEFIMEHNKLNHMKGKQRKTEEEVKRVQLGGTCELLESTLPSYELQIPEIALLKLGIYTDKEHITDQIRFIQENDRVYLEKA